MMYDLNESNVISFCVNNSWFFFEISKSYTIIEVYIFLSILPKIMYQTLQRFLSIVLIAVLLFWITFRIPYDWLYSQTEAWTTQVYSLVSILVEESIYPQVKSKVERYADDIQKHLENTRVVVMPTPQSASVFDIASLNENLYYSGYKWVNKKATFNSKLVWTVLIWSLPVPVVHDSGQSSKTLFPYIDFEDKKYVYDHATKKYQVNNNSREEFSPEIWHWVVAPNFWDRAKNIQAIRNYFDKNHDYYSWTWNFQASEWILNGNNVSGIPEDYTPQVFYYDQFREQEALSFEKYHWYLAYLENKEDLIYSRYSRELSEKIKNKVLGNEQEQIRELIQWLELDVDVSSFWSGPDVSKASDISTRFITKNVVKKYLEVINTSKIWEFRKDVHNAWRYNGDWKEVHVDMVPYLISVLDVVWDEVIKWVNNDLEKEIDSIVEWWLARDMAIPIASNTSWWNTWYWSWDCSVWPAVNIMYWKLASDITNTYDCTIYRWSTTNGWTLVEANRWLNIDHVGSDLNLCAQWNVRDRAQWWTQGYWWGNSPINLDQSSMANADIKLSNVANGAPRSLHSAIRPLFDMKWAREVSDANLTPSPLNCYNANYFPTTKSRWVTVSRGQDDSDTICELYFRLPYKDWIDPNTRKSGRWTCNTHNTFTRSTQSFWDTYKNLRGPDCSTHSISLNGRVVKSLTWGAPRTRQVSEGGGESSTETICWPRNVNYSYTQIPSIMKHVSPTPADIKAQVWAMITQSLPIDKDRYVDFIAASWEYAKIDYPYLFRLKKDLSTFDTLDDKLWAIKKEVDKFLDTKSDEINTVITSNRVTNLSWEDKEVADFFATGNYPTANVDLKKILQSKAQSAFTISWESKKINYYDTLVFWVFWNNLDSIAQKYQFIFENYLSDQFWNDSEYSLPKNKKSYEIAYLWAPWDAQNMYIKVDPDNKGKHPYPQIVSDNSLINSHVFSSQVSADTDNKTWVFKCSPPEWVPLWEWLPAIMCRLKDILPPKININANKCWGLDAWWWHTNFYDFGQNAEVCSKDTNNNWANDCLEEDVRWASLQLRSDVKRSYYNKTVTLDSELLNSSGATLTNVHHISTQYELLKVEAPKDVKKDFNEVNSKVVFDKNTLNEESYNEARKYISFSESFVPVNNWKSKYHFTSKWNDANVYFRSNFVLNDWKWNVLQRLESNIVKVEIRGDMLFGTFIELSAEQKTSNILRASNVANVYLLDGNQSSIDTYATVINNSSLAPVKGVISLDNYSVNWSKSPIQYPITVSLFRDWKQILEPLIYREIDLSTYRWVFALSRSGRYEVKIQDALGNNYTQDIQVAPAEVADMDIQLWSNIIQTNGTITSNAVILKDAYGNIVTGEAHEILVKTPSEGIQIVSDESENLSQRSYSTFDWYTAFRLIPTVSEGTNTITIEVFKDSERRISKNVQIRTVDAISMRIAKSESNFSVGNKDYTLNLEYIDKQWKLLSNFHSQAYLHVNSLYGSFDSEVVKIVNWKASVPFSSRTLAWKEVPIRIHTQWVFAPTQYSVAILPWRPVKIDAVASKKQLQARIWEQSTLSLELKDRYNNIVFTDSTTEIWVSFNAESSKIMKSAENKKKVSWWIANFTLNATATPGKAYALITSDPDLWVNSYVVGAWDSAVAVNGVGKNVVEFDTYYFWNKDSLTDKKYNGLYSVLFWAEYGDYTQENYLAWSLLYDKNNRSLWVTSLLNNPQKFQDVLAISSQWGILDTTHGSDLSQDISLDVWTDGKKNLAITLFNESLNTHIWTLYYNIGWSMNMRSCIGDTDDFSDCGVNNELSSVLMKSLSDEYSVSSIGWGVDFINAYWEKLISISNEGDFETFSSLELDVSEGTHEWMLTLDIISAKETVWKIGIELKWSQFLISRNDVNTQTKLQNTINSRILSLSSYLYWVREVYSEWGTWYALYYKDPFWDEKALDTFSQEDFYWWENFQNQQWIGWNDGSTFLLSFAAWNIAGEALKESMSFGMVHHWDPVIQLKKITKKLKGTTWEKSFDPTIGKLLTNREGIIDYEVFDYDNDQKDDILLIQDTGYFSLLENKAHSEPFLDKGNVAYVADMWSSELVEVGDFSWDWHDDIFFVNDSWEPFLLNNVEKDFSRIALDASFTLDWKIIQVQSYDMDNDTLSDLVTLDDKWDVHIFYWWGDSRLPLFTKKFIGDWYWLTLDNTILTTWAFVRFDWIPESNEQEVYDRYLEDAERYQSLRALNSVKARNAVNSVSIPRLTDANQNTDNAYTSIDESQFDSADPWINESLIDKLIYEKIYYSGLQIAPDASISTAELISKFPLPNTNNSEFSDLSDGLEKTRTEVADFLNTYSGSVNVSIPQEIEASNFVKSEYAKYMWVEIEKKYTDDNWWNIQTGDSITVEVKMKNISTQALNNVVFVDTLEKYFVKSDEGITLTKWLQRSAPTGYDILVDQINLASWEELIFKYSMNVRPIRFGYLQVGLFEEWEAWDDVYGDILIKPNQKNCSESVDMYRSLATLRTYSKDVHTPSCNPAKSKLPDVLEKNRIDTNNNGVPDYIDTISSSVESQQAYAQSELSKSLIDTDNDGHPDSEDDAPGFNNEVSDGNFLWILDQVNEKIDDMSEGVDTLMEWFWCGFWWGSCITTPLNWAPLAAGWDPTFMWTPIGDWLKVNEWVPIFSAFTGLNIYGWWCFQVPTFWPMTSNRFAGWCNGDRQAGWKLWVTSPTNFVRLFASPTLTGWFGMAACYGWPAIATWNAIPQWISPVIPGWNCIVAAKPLFGCSNDWSEGDPESLGQPDMYGNFGVINANCGQWITTPQSPELPSDFVKQYADFKKSGTKDASLASNYKSALKNISNDTVSSSKKSIFGWMWWSVEDVSISLDLSRNSEWNFDDVVQVKKQRTSSFPWFIMEWVTQQWEEFISKLTDLPTLFVVLPDMSSLFETDWQDYIEKGQKEIQEKAKKEESTLVNNSNVRLESIRKRKVSAGCGTSWDNSRECLALDIEEGQIKNKKRDYEKSKSLNQVTWLKTAYEFLGSIPLIDVEAQKVTINYPAVDDVSLNRWKIDAQSSLDQWKEERNNFVSSLSQIKNQDCSVKTGQAQIECNNFNADFTKKIWAKKQDLLKFVDWLQKNIQTVEEYKELPKKISKLLNKKQEWTEQLMCSVDALSSFTGSWITENGKRFKAWVEVYMLIKAILKSWQLMIDIFTGYDAECHECKNERNDLLQYQFKLVSMILPKLPVIKFPKWPDIILDLHNIRLSIVVQIPDFVIEQRPVTLPSLPELRLPIISWNINASTNLDLDFDLPDMPVLPSVEIPELPDLPWLPSIELPNLPPPPTLPKIFSGFKAMVNIAKLVTKAMCIMKSSPFVPEWRSGDQIAFMTERNGYLPTDFIDMSLPSVSFPVFDAIKVTTKVNFEMQTDFMVEMARQIVEPVNNIWNNISGAFSNAWLDSLDFSSASQNFDVNIDATINNDWVDIEASTWSTLIVQSATKLHRYLSNNSNERVSSREFITLVQEGLSHIDITSKTETEWLQTLWNNVEKYNFAAEDKKIAELKEASKRKFDVFSRILENEQQKTKKLIKSLEVSPEKKLFTAISDTAWRWSDDFVWYQKSLDHENLAFMKSARDLVTGKQDSEVSEIKKQWDDLNKRLHWGLSAYSAAHNWLLAATWLPLWWTQNSCQQSHSSPYHYNYKWLYVVESGKSYRLFDYLDELTWEESYSPIDVDGDSDTDLLYMVWNQVYLKENLQKVDNTDHTSLPILTVSKNDNSYFNGDNFLEAINWFREINTDSRVVNLAFNAPTNTNTHNFSIKNYTIIDKATWEWRTDYSPKNIFASITDAFDSIEDIIIDSRNEVFTKRNHLVSIEYVWTAPWVTLSTNKMKNIKEDIAANTSVNISPGTQLYTSNNDTKIKYYLGNDEINQFEMILDAFSSYQFVESVKITWITGNAYVVLDEKIELTWAEEISNYTWLPLFEWTTLKIIWDFRPRFNESSHIDLVYYDGSKKLLNLSDIHEYRIYDLGTQSDDYLVRYDVPNDYYYSTITPFRNNYITTPSAQILSSPQREADTFAPELQFTWKIRVPVYQKKVIDLSNSIYDNTWLSWIESVTVDTDLDVDSDSDGNPKNDNDTDKLTIIKTVSKVSIEFWEFEELFEKDIAIRLEDENNNVSIKEVPLEVYAPIPYIRTATDDSVQWVLSEKLTWEPINLYRMRGGVLKRLEDENGEIKVYTSKDWVYNFWSATNATGLEITSNGVIVATVNEFTWKIDLKNGWSQIVVSSWEGGYPKTAIQNLSWWELYSQQIKLIDSVSIKQVENFSEVEEKWIYMKFEAKDLYDYYMIPTASQYNPWVVVIYAQWDALKKPVFTIYPDGRLTPSNELFSLDYFNEGEMFGYKLISRTWWKVIAELVYSLEASYLMR